MSYEHPNDNNLKNLHKAMSYNASGEPVVRTHVDGISLQGDVIVDTVSLSPSTLAALETINIGNIPEVEIKNDSGNPIPVEWVYGNGASLIPWELQVARGKIPGVTNLSIAGYNAAIPNTWTPVWEYPIPYVYFSTAQQVRVWSDSNSDTNMSVTINGLDASYNQITETIVLTNGQTGVMSTLSYLRVNNMNLTRTPMNVGNISVGSSDKSITLATIMPDSGRSQMSIYTVPAGYTFYLTQTNVYTSQTGSQTGLYRSYTKTSGGVINTILIFPFTDTYISRKVAPRPYAEKTDIQWQVQSSQGTSKMGIQIEGFLVANTNA